MAEKPFALFTSLEHEVNTPTVHLPLRYREYTVARALTIMGRGGLRLILDYLRYNPYPSTQLKMGLISVMGSIGTELRIEIPSSLIGADFTEWRAWAERHANEE